MPNPLDISGPIMLCALAFVLTHGDFFSRQELAIIRLQLSDSTVCLPPYPKVPVIQPEHKENALKNTVETFQDTIAYQSTIDDSILSPYYLWLFEHREKLKLHQQALEQR
ncbi:unnamed protein product [Aphanomyces euteiches]